MATVLQHIRRNHAIEHATMHVLATAMVRPRLMAHSDWAGVTFYGNVDPEVLQWALDRGLSALQAGQRGLAVHPRCGSGITAALLLTFLPAWLTHCALRRRYPWLRGIITLSGVVGGLVLAQPLGRAAQAHLLTDADVSTARLFSLRSAHRGPLALHRVTIEHN